MTSFSPSLQLSGSLDLLLPITALLPLTATLMVAQANPYQTLVLRGILGSVSTLIYALLGAPDVALTEALVGTLLSTTLYAVALRSSMALRLAVPADTPLPRDLQDRLRTWIDPLHLRLRLVPLADPAAGGEGLHGHLTGDARLVLHRRSLMLRLQQLDGHRQWLAAGGDLCVEGEP
jgi:putative multicomponent Na+:H+ antiporter subunit B